MVRELDSGRVGSHPVKVVRKAADRTGFDRRSLVVVDVVADIADIPAAGSFPADSFLEVLRSLVLVLATRIGLGDTDCTAGRIDCRDQTW